MPGSENLDQNIDTILNSIRREWHEIGTSLPGSELKRIKHKYIQSREATFSSIHPRRPWRICRWWSSSGQSPQAAISSREAVDGIWIWRVRPPRLVRPNPRQRGKERLGALRRGRHGHGTEHVVHVVPVDPMPGGRLDLATDALVLPDSSDPLFPVPRGRGRRNALCQDRLGWPVRGLRPAPASPSAPLDPSGRGTRAIRASGLMPAETPRGPEPRLEALKPVTARALG